MWNRSVQITLTLVYCYRCVCPGNSAPPRCKVLSRHFPPITTPLTTTTTTATSAVPPHHWLEALPTCSKLHLSLHFLTNVQEGVIATAGSALQHHKHHNSRNMAILVTGGKPLLRLRLRDTETDVVIRLEKSIADNKWHRLDLLWVNEVSLERLHRTHR